MADEPRPGDHALALLDRHLGVGAPLDDRAIARLEAVADEVKALGRAEFAAALRRATSVEDLQVSMSAVFGDELPKSVDWTAAQTAVVDDILEALERAYGELPARTLLVAYPVVQGRRLGWLALPAALAVAIATALLIGVPPHLAAEASLPYLVLLPAALTAVLAALWVWLAYGRPRHQVAGALVAAVLLVGAVGAHEVWLERHVCQRGRGYVLVAALDELTDDARANAPAVEAQELQVSSLRCKYGILYNQAPAWPDEVLRRVSQELVATEVARTTATGVAAAALVLLVFGARRERS